MTEHEKPLPRPPKTPFSKGPRNPEAGDQGLMADKMAEAAALGKLDEYLEQELPDSEQARALARMMMGMTGMLPSGDQTAPRADENKASTLPPQDVVQAIQGGDVQGLMGLLRREHQKRTPEAEAPVSAEAPSSRAPDQPAIDKDLIDSLIRIAADNSVTLDWIILRAIKVYVEEYRKTGKL